MTKYVYILYSVTVSICWMDEVSYMAASVKSWRLSANFNPWKPEEKDKSK